MIGLGSNVLAPDEGVDALVVRLEGELAWVEADGAVLRAGGGASNAVCLHRARAAELGGIEVRMRDPGMAGGGVRMNVGVYGSVRLAGSARARWWSMPTGGDLAVGHRPRAGYWRLRWLLGGEVVAASSTRRPRDWSSRSRRRSRRAVAQRKSTQPMMKRTFGSVRRRTCRSSSAKVRMLQLGGLRGDRIGARRQTAR